MAVSMSVNVVWCPNKYIPKVLTILIKDKNPTLNNKNTTFVSIDIHQIIEVSEILWINSIAGFLWNKSSYLKDIWWTAEVTQSGPKSNKPQESDHPIKKLIDKF